MKQQNSQPGYRFKTKNLKFLKNTFKFDNYNSAHLRLAGFGFFIFLVAGAVNAYSGILGQPFLEKISIIIVYISLLGSAAIFLYELLSSGKTVVREGGVRYIDLDFQRTQFAKDNAFELIPEVAFSCYYLYGPIDDNGKFSGYNCLSGNASDVAMNIIDYDVKFCDGINKLNVPSGKTVVILYADHQLPNAIFSAAPIDKLDEKTMRNLYYGAETVAVNFTYMFEKRFWGYCLKDRERDVLKIVTTELMEKMLVTKVEAIEFIDDKVILYYDWLFVTSEDYDILANDLNNLWPELKENIS